jgi:predicted metal-dependent HD superfamily phosphohydrolase
MSSAPAHAEGGRHYHNPPHIDARLAHLASVGY